MKNPQAQPKLRWVHVASGNTICLPSAFFTRLDLPIKQELKEILDRSINLPIDRHQLCLENNNRIHFVHTDDELFRTPDISQTPEAKELNIGAMAIELYYSDGFEKDEIYRKIGQSKACIPLKIEKLQHYASSTVLYHYTLLSQTDEFYLEGLGKLSLTRIIANPYIDTNKSSAYIVPRWYLFLLTLILAG